MGNVIQFKKNEERAEREQEKEIVKYVSQAAEGISALLTAYAQLEAENTENLRKLEIISKMISFEERQDFHDYVSENQAEIYGDDLLYDVRTVVLQYLIAWDRKKSKKVSQNS